MSQPIDRFRSSTLGWLTGTLAGWGTLILCLVGVGLVILLVKWIINLGVTYTLTDDRLILEKGILQKSIDEIELYRIKDVRIDFSVINQMADIGTITITSSDETTRDAPLVIRDVAHARARREKLRELVNAARRLRGVREVDMVQEGMGEV
ncbi:PH domain-containing protein [Sphingomonas sp.]|uniref:PH domain-containing protein n=1 Tax=Sphingomonas sp. TaxID=28214 RepID=UPI001B22CC65|nr:PH domain-containing protein [Sphingomonas sp.]MBO9715129.1 PH domain-containing protein [Sphingomonas sp.]